MEIKAISGMNSKPEVAEEQINSTYNGCLKRNRKCEERIWISEKNDKVGKENPIYIEENQSKGTEQIRKTIRKLS